MHRSDVLAHLAMAQEHVASGEEHLARQLALINKLERDGHDSSTARAFLQQLEETQLTHIAPLQRLQREAADQQGAS
jgi:hypothetical protein